MAALQEFDDEELVEEESVLDVPPEYRDLQATERKMTVGQLADLYSKDKLNLQPEFQREYVWDDKRASRFVESLLLNLPVPPIFVAENEDRSLEVVDGHQRLQSLFGFLRALTTARDKFVPASFRALKLKGLEVLDDLNGCGIQHLTPSQRDMLMEHKLTVIAIPKSADPDLRFALFERLNLGSVPLNPQELRNCIYRGPYNDLIREIASEARTLSLLGRKGPSKRMRERELVLRFFTLLHRRTELRVPFQMFLNDEMDNNRQASGEDLQRFRWEFSQARDWAQHIFKQHACCWFRAGDEIDAAGRWGQWNDLIYEVQSVGFSEFAHDLARTTRDVGGDADLFLEGLRSRLIDVMCMDAFLETCTEFPRSPKNTARRFNIWTDAISSAIRNSDMVMDQALPTRCGNHQCVIGA